MLPVTCVTTCRDASKYQGMSMFFVSCVAAPCITTCKGASKGDHSWCGKCEEYLTCFKGQATLRYCPAGLAFDKDAGEAGQCVHYAKLDGCLSKHYM